MRRIPNQHSANHLMDIDMRLQAMVQEMENFKQVQG
jgi:hypothetical protein